MSKVLIQFADQDFIVSPETAARVQNALPADRFVTVTPIREPELQLSQNKQKSSVFQRYQPKLNDKEQAYANRIAKHMSKQKE